MRIGPPLPVETGASRCAGGEPGPLGRARRWGLLPRAAFALFVCTFFVFGPGCTRARCLTSDDCPSGKRCRAGACEDPSTAPDGFWETHGGTGDGGNAEAGPDGGAADAASCVDDAGCEPCRRCDASSGRCVPVDDGTTCDEGICYGGSCCTGCWDGETCHDGTEDAACGGGGGACENCICPGAECAEGACRPAVRVVSLSVGTQHACAVGADGSLWCWGRNDDGRLGNGTAGDGTEAVLPTRVGGDTGWRQVGLGDEHSCAVKADSSLYCWGENSDGQLGTGGTSDARVPTLVSAGREFRLVRGSSRGDHTCALTVGNDLYCWGQNDRGQVGVGLGEPDLEGRIPDVQYPTPVTGGPWTDVTLGHAHGCALGQDGTIWCWGQNDDGQLGLGDAAVGTDEPLPVQVGAGTDWALVSASEYSTCATKTDGSLWCWGRNEDGELGFGDVTLRASPEQVGTEVDWAGLIRGTRQRGALRGEGTLWMWGSNEYAELGIGAAGEDELSPLRVGEAGRWASGSGGEGATCFRETTGRVFCAGANEWGQLGVGDTATRSRPAVVCVE